MCKIVMVSYLFALFWQTCEIERADNIVKEMSEVKVDKTNCSSSSSNDKSSGYILQITLKQLDDPSGHNDSQLVEPQH